MIVLDVDVLTGVNVSNHLYVSLTNGDVSLRGKEREREREYASHVVVFISFFFFSLMMMK